MAINRIVKMQVITRLKDGDKVAHIAKDFEISEGTVRSIKHELMPTTDTTLVPKEALKVEDDSDNVDDERIRQEVADETEPADAEGDDIDFVKALMVGADKAIIYRKTITVTIEFNKGEK